MPELDVYDAIARFGLSASRVAQIMDAGRVNALTSPAPVASMHAAALYAYTEESPLYGTLNYLMRTPHTDTELKRYFDYIVHIERALSSLLTHVSERMGKVYRGIKVLLLLTSMRLASGSRGRRSRHRPRSRRQRSTSSKCCLS